MSQETNISTQHNHSASLAKRMIVGATIAAIVIAVFLANAGGKPEWPRFWMVRPLIIVPLAGGLGGAFYHFMDRLRWMGGWKKLTANIISLIGFLVLLWMGMVFGLDGTWWD